MKDISEAKYIDLSLGELVGGPPFSLKQHLGNIIQGEWKGYLEPSGMKKLREVVKIKSQHLFEKELTEDQILITTGASQALSSVYHVIPQKKLLVPQLGFPLYKKTAEQMGILLYQYHIGPEVNWDKTLEEIEDGFRQGIKAILWNVPHNPLGIIPPKNVVRALSDLCTQYNTMCISDEVYRDFKRESEIISPVQYIPERTLFIYSFSKAYAMAGMRIGFIIGHPHIIKILSQVHWNSNMSTSWIAQEAALYALNNLEGFPQSLSQKVSKRMSKACEIFKNNGISFIEPQGGIFICLDVSPLKSSSKKFVLNALINENLDLMPGHEFGMNGDTLVRMNCGINDEDFDEALKRIVQIYCN
ncbi:pyridoxal phosphate-dependent aminotransferase [Bacillus infantis]|uniref:pyridoxal phosphate-dependent aminotransferase n=1 Tax=Bacillus infantis TaxID=324767 RepID=UPI003CE7211E